MSFRDNSFDISIDKGTYDALAVSLNKEVVNMENNGGVCSADPNPSRRSSA